MKALAKFRPALLHELHDLLSFTTAHPERIDADLLDSLYALRISGTPKAKPGDSRPIGVASVIIRSWHSSLLPFLPEVPEDQYLSVGAVKAYAKWWAAPLPHGSEHDLSAAFDRVHHEVALIACRYAGTASTFVAYIARVLKGTRYIVTRRDHTAPIFPTSGLAQGDPMSPLLLCLALAPWAIIVRRRFNVTPSLYMDDRAIKALRKAARDAAISWTRTFDAAVGFKANVDKEQVWSGSDPVEHLGLIGPGLPEDNSVPTLRPRGGWDRLELRISSMATIPGGLCTKSALCRQFIAPLWFWAGARLPAPPESTMKGLFRAAVGRSTWWCRGRFYADHIDLHSQLGAAISVLFHAHWLQDLVPSPWGVKLFTQHAKKLHLKIEHWSVEDGLWASVLPSFHHPSVPPALLDAAYDPEKDPVLATNHSNDSVRLDSPRGGHFLRQLARCISLSSCNRKRYDYEGLDNVDIHASHSKRWLKFFSYLSDSDKHLVARWRSGAVWTPSRRYHTGTDGHCPFGCSTFGSMHHFVTECPRFHSRRLRHPLMSAPGWASLPRCLTKSGWVPYSVSDYATQRVDILFATADVAVAVMRDLIPFAAESHAAYAAGGL